MRLSKKDIEYISGLARLKLNEKEKEKYTKELSAILDFIDQLNKADTDLIEPLYQTTGLINAVRKDENPHGAEQSKINQMMGQAPKVEGNFIKVKPVLNKE